MNKIDKSKKRKALSYYSIAKGANILAQCVYLLAKEKEFQSLHMLYRCLYFHGNNSIMGVIR